MSHEGTSSLKRRLEELEKEVKMLREPLENTLMDVRELISNLENPFNYISSFIDLSESRSKPVRHEEKVVQKPRKFEEVAEKRVEPSGSLLAALACGCLLLRLLGRENTMRFINSRIVKQLISADALERLNDAIEFLLKNEEFQGMYVPGRRPLSYESLIAAAYVVSALSSIDDEKFFTALLLGLKGSDLEVMSEKG